MLNLNVVVEKLGADVLAQLGEPVGLSAEKSLEVAKALAAHWSEGPAEAVRLAAQETQVAEEVVAEMSQRLLAHGGEMLMTQTPVGAAVEQAKAQAEQAKDQAIAAAGGFFSRLLGRK